MLSVLGCGWCQAQPPNLWGQPQGLGPRKHQGGAPWGGARYCVRLHVNSQSRVGGGGGRRAQSPSPSSAGEPEGAASSAQLTLHPEREELLRRARWVLGHTHVAGSVGHLCRGNLWVQGHGAGQCHGPAALVPAPQGPLGGIPPTIPGTAGTQRRPSEGHVCPHRVPLSGTRTPCPSRAFCDIQDGTVRLGLVTPYSK